jgi:hypothetical protein
VQQARANDKLTPVILVGVSTYSRKSAASKTDMIEPIAPPLHDLDLFFKEFVERI